VAPARARQRRGLRLAIVVVAIGLALWLGIAGGEYSTLDLVRQRRHRESLTRDIDSLTRLVDSLRTYRQRVLTDPRTQERIAREEFGMVRGKELLYRFAEPPDSALPDTR
jgi:cell division protein FtsB